MASAGPGGMAVAGRCPFFSVRGGVEGSTWGFWSEVGARFPAACLSVPGSWPQLQILRDRRYSVGMSYSCCSPDSFSFSACGFCGPFGRDFPPPGIWELYQVPGQVATVQPPAVLSKWLERPMGPTSSVLAPLGKHHSSSPFPSVPKVTLCRPNDPRACFTNSLRALYRLL